MNVVICEVEAVRNTLTGMKRKPLSAKDKAAAARLKRIWSEKKDELDLKQDRAAELLGFNTQGAVSHYINGYTPLNTDAVLKFAKLLRVSPTDIRPEIEQLLEAARANHASRREIKVQAIVPLISWVEATNWCGDTFTPKPGYPELWVHTTAKVSKNAFALRIRGDSMVNPNGFPTFPPGATIIVDPEVKPEDGSFVIVGIPGEEEALFQKLTIHAGRKYLSSLNPRYPPPFELPAEACICGVVKRMEIDL
jgi:SOS-response transcriptional repressor LexA